MSSLTTDLMSIRTLEKVNISSIGKARLLYDFSSNKILLKSIFLTLITFLLSIFIFYTDIHLKKLVDNICYFHEKQL